MMTSARGVLLDVPHLTQPDDVSCGPVCLASVLSFFGDTRGLERISASVHRNPDGGTLGVYLGLAAIELGFRASLISTNLRVFDPTWRGLASDALVDKLEARAAAVSDARLARVVRAYVRFARLGGEVGLDELSEGLLEGFLRRGRPVLCGLSSTYLYQSAREDPWTNEPDDVAGEPAGHFVVIVGVAGEGDRFVISDPYPAGLGRPRYEVTSRRLLNAILLGDATYDGVLLVVEPR